MKFVMYGSEICSDCVKAKELLQKYEYIDWDYKNITANTTTLKEFLSYRDHDPMFTSVVNEGKIGIPFFILEDGTKTFNIYDFIDTIVSDSKQSEMARSEMIKSESKQLEPIQPEQKQDKNACSLDGKGC